MLRSSATGGISVAKSGISRLLIASAIDAGIYRRLVESPEEIFDEFEIPCEDRELLRQPDHRLLRLLGAALVEERAPTTAAGVATTAATSAVPGAIPPSAPPHTLPASASLPEMSLVLTLVPCAIYDGDELKSFAYATWVSPLADGADPETLPPPPDTVLPGKPLPPLRAVMRVSAIQFQDAGGNPLVGLSVALLQSTNMSAPPLPSAAGNPAATSRNHSTPEVQSAIAAVRCALVEARYGKLIELLRVLHPEGTA